jgi:pimeloyl-ACP methyl ester carboxylesterase
MTPHLSSGELVIRLAPAACLALIALNGCQARDAAPAPVTEAAWTDPAPHRSGFVTANGVRLHYLDWGGTGPALVLIHGYGDNPHAFDDLAPAFTDRFRVVAYARRGHGRSEAKPPYDTATLTEDLRQLMDSLGVARAHLAGWSMGGNEITAMAGTYPDRVDRIAYLDAAFDWADPASVAAFDSLPANLTPPAEAMTSLDAYRASHVAVWFPGMSDLARVEAYVRDLVVVQPDGTVRPAMADSVGQAMFATLLTDRRDYGKVKAPALAIYAETFFDVAHGDSSQRAKNLAWEQKFMVPFRAASIDRVRRELRQVGVVSVPGTHADFLFTSREQVVDAMRRFLGDAAGQR